MNTKIRVAPVAESPDVLVITITRSKVLNCVDRETADALHDAFIAFDQDPNYKVAILTGEGGNFCSGADLKALTAGNGNRLDPDMDKPAPMGPTRLLLSKPVIAAIDGYAVAGGIELACWCDLRVCSERSVFGVFCRVRGVPLIDGGTVRLPRLIGLSRAMDLILTGRRVTASEALQIGLAHRVVARPEDVLPAAIELAKLLASHPQTCMREDRASVYHALYGSTEDSDRGLKEALRKEFECGMRSMTDVEGLKSGVGKFLSKQAKL